MDIKGQFNTAKVFTDTLEDSCIAQIKEICSLKIFSNNNICIMPDVHSGKGSVIGFTIACSPSPNFMIPNIIGVDIGCGVSVLELGDMEIDLRSLDNFIRKQIPTVTRSIRDGKRRSFPRSL